MDDGFSMWNYEAIFVVERFIRHILENHLSQTGDPA